MGQSGALDEFLKAVAETLKKEDAADTDMAEILQAHILKAAPAQDAVSKAKDAIIKLAGQRASPPKLEVDDG